jgi:hypothetical protein
MASALVLIARRFKPFFSLARSVRLAYLPNIYLIDIKRPCLLKFFFDARI